MIGPKYEINIFRRGKDNPVRYWADSYADAITGAFSFFDHHSKVERYIPWDLISQVQIKDMEDAIQKNKKR